VCSARWSSGARRGACEGFGAAARARSIWRARSIEMADAPTRRPRRPRFTYELGESRPEKVEKIATAFYGANDVVLTNKAEKDIERIGASGCGKLPVCMAKTQLSLTDDPTKAGPTEGLHGDGARGAPSGGRGLRGAR
jgi:formate--tetrahydrofolate ligase